MSTCSGPESDAPRIREDPQPSVPSSPSVGPDGVRGGGTRHDGSLADLLRLALSASPPSGTVVIARYRFWMHRIQEAGDLCSVALAYILASALWSVLQHRQWLGPLREDIPGADWTRNALVTAALLLPVFHAVGLYRGHHSLLNIREYELLLRGWLATLVATVVTLFFIERSFQSRGIFLTVWGILLPLLYLHRFAFYHLTMRLHRRGAVETRAAIYGTGKMGRNLLSKLRRSPRLGYDIVGFLDDSPLLSGTKVEGLPVLGPLRELPALAQAAGFDLLFIAIPQMPHTTMLEALQLCRRQRIRYRIIPSLYEIVLDRIRYTELDGLPLVEISPTRPSSRVELAKRLFDIVLASSLLLFLLPLLLPLLSAIRILSPDPLLRREARTGRGGLPFLKLSFKTTSKPENAGSRRRPGWTALSRMLDATGLRHLPALWNVVRGDLSMVGPEPVSPEDIGRPDALQRQQFVVRPGLTGLWRITHDRSPDHRMECVFFYIQNMSLPLDLVILARSLAVWILGPPLPERARPGR